MRAAIGNVTFQCDPGVPMKEGFTSFIDIDAVWLFCLPVVSVETIKISMRFSLTSNLLMSYISLKQMNRK
jgi:hypothetical protein